MRRLFSAALALAGLIGMSRLAGADELPVVAGCPDACVEKVCRPVVETKTITKPVFTSVCEEVCEPRCWSCGLFGRCSSCGPDHSCVMHTRKFLVVKLRKHEECVNKCVVDYTPSCTTCAPGYAPAPSMVPQMEIKPAPEPLPLPKSR